MRRPVEKPKRSQRVWRPWSAAALALLALAACQAPGTLDPDQVRDEVTTVLEGYLPKLAEAHATGDPSLLEGYAVQKEQAALQFQLDNNTDRGERVVPTLQQFTVADIEVARTTAYVSTSEVWQLERRSLGGDVLIESYPDERYRVRYQLKKVDGRWLVFYRQSERESES